MKTVLKNTLILLLPAIVFTFAACNDNKVVEEDPFTGKDSYITAFSLQQGDAVFHAAIVGEEITVTVPEGFSLMQAKATVKLSENAAIYPDPAAVTAWDEEQQFAVTAHNGAQTKYTYTVTHSGVAYSGTVLLYTQAEVDAFGQQGVTLLEGNLIVGRAVGTDTITSLAPLAGLKEVVYNLTVNPTFAGAGLTGLEALEHVGGTLQTGAAPYLETVALPALKSAGAIVLQNPATIIVQLPELAGVTKQLSLNCPLFQLQLPGLQHIGGALTLTTPNASLTSLDEVSLPALEETGSITVSAFPTVTKIDLPQLKKAAGLRCTSMSKLSLIYAPLLEEVTGSVYLTGLNALAELELPALKQTDEIYVATCSVLSILTFPKLTDVTVFNLQSPPVNSLAGFSSLQTAGAVTLNNLKELDRVEFSTSVQRIDRLTVSGSPAPSEINVRGINIGTLSLSGTAAGTGKLIGDDNTRFGALLISMVNASPMPTRIPQLEGFSEIDSLFVQSMSALEVHVSGIRKTRRGFYITTGNAQYPRAFSVSDLEEVGGSFRISFTYMSSSPETFTDITFDKLERVGGNIIFEAQTASVDILSFPKLKTVGGNLNLHTGHTYSSVPFKGFERIELPELTAVGGKLTLESTSSFDYNNRLKNLDGFAALTSVGSIEVKGNKALVDYQGLEELFKTLPQEKWITPANNGYNPTWQDLKDGKWTKPVIVISD
ncbi:MAG: DUF5018 domain-containing protein [Bacteroidales bacterium]|jgi:hypothetical protein|nr:DUF5018 domain-containing protein [Bacteroidales bacterium]